MERPKSFLAVLEKSNEGYGVFFPDLPGCVSGGVDFEDAVTSAEEALALHIEGMLEDGEEIPTPIRKEDYKSEPNECVILVKVETSEKKQRINVMLPASLISAIDAKSTNRSEFLTQAARKALLA